MNYVAFKPEGVQARMNAAGIPWRGVRAFLCIEYVWDKVAMQKERIVGWTLKMGDATPFQSEGQAWREWEATGAGFREDYEVVENERGPA